MADILLMARRQANLVGDAGLGESVLNIVPNGAILAKLCAKSLGPVINAETGTLGRHPARRTSAAACQRS
ncbi:hypothetical protein IVB08_01910 [Bradyrhizobium sp. 173]|uniref:hypothetical protein n=1 Tax=Bradyrhizobium sp. 173 TaxID=2782644 RepID=UPI001FFA468D|nr:hypothetical protein [Bradyrhizobium sp. 173]MCK1562767.1 hypothetical protein [Bradyrhizobium sp. 173]